MKKGRIRRRMIGIGAGVLCLLTFTQCHFVSRPFRKADTVLTLKTTGYCACGKCCSWKFNWIGTPVYSSGRLKGRLKIIGKTASGKMASPGTVAVDPKLFPMGTRFYIPGYGWAIAQDTGRDVKGKHLDLFHWTHGCAKEWGVQNVSVKVWYP